MREYPHPFCEVIEKLFNAADHLRPNEDLAADAQWLSVICEWMKAIISSVDEKDSTGWVFKEMKKTPAMRVIPKHCQPPLWDVLKVLHPVARCFTFDDDFADHEHWIPDLCEFMELLVNSMDADGETLLGMEVRAFLASYDEDMEEEIVWQTKVVAAKQVLLDGADDPIEHMKFLGFDWEDAVGECVILAALQADVDRLDETEETLRLADAIAKANGVPFDREVKWNELRS